MIEAFILKTVADQWKFESHQDGEEIQCRDRFRVTNPLTVGEARYLTVIADLFVPKAAYPATTASRGKCR